MGRALRGIEHFLQPSDDLVAPSRLLEGNSYARLHRVMFQGQSLVNPEDQMRLDVEPNTVQAEATQLAPAGLGAFRPPLVGRGCPSSKL